MEPLKVTLHRAKETKNTIRFEEPEGGEPPIIGTLYLQKWATHRLEDPETITARSRSGPARYRALLPPERAANRARW